MKIFVTVGTTKFDSLIQTVFTGAVQKALSDKKYTQMVVQFGRSDCFDELNTTLDTSELKLDLCEKFSLRPDIIEYIKQADLIIGHAGAGTCLEGKIFILIYTKCQFQARNFRIKTIRNKSLF